MGVNVRFGITSLAGAGIQVGGNITANNNGLNVGGNVLSSSGMAIVVTGGISSSSTYGVLSIGEVESTSENLSGSAAYIRSITTKNKAS